MKQAGLPIVLALFLLAFPAWSSTWQEAGRGAVAILPPPEKAEGVTGASLFCAEQRWSFLFRLEPESVASDATMPGVLTAGRTRFAVEGSPKNGQVVVPIAANMLEPIKASTHLTLEMGKDKSLKAEFVLTASRTVIDAIAPRCSAVDMSVYERIEPSEIDPAIAEARALLAGEERLFYEATGYVPAFAARKLDLPDGRGLLVASLCGSTYYYGESGCSLFGFVRSSPGENWRLAYDTEGVQLYLDSKSGNDFPDLLTLPMTGGTEPSQWVWTGAAYEIRDEMMAEGRHTGAGRAQ